MMIVAGALRKRSDTVFEADFTTASLGAGSVTGYGLSYERLSPGYSVQTGTSTVVVGGSIDTASIPGFGKELDSDLPGVCIEELRLNRWQNCRSASSLFAAGTTTNNANSFAGPDGSMLADDVTCTSGSNYGSWDSTGFTERRTHSYWHKSDGAGSGASKCSDDGGVNNYLIFSGTEPAAWIRSSKTPATTSGATVRTYLIDGRDLTGIGGPAAGARASAVDLSQCEPGLFPTQVIVTTGTANVTRAAPRLWRVVGNTLLAADGSLRYYAECKPNGASSEYSADMTLWYADANNHAEVDHTTLQIKVTIGGTLYSTPVTMTWARRDTLRIWVAAGGSVVTEVKYSTNASSPIILSTGSPTTFGAITISSTLDIFNANKSTVFSAFLQRFRTYKVGRKPDTF